MKGRRLKIWIDLENSPHVLFFEPVIHELEKLGHTVYTTARGFCNTLDLVKAKRLLAKPIGFGYERGRTELIKWSFFAVRMLQLQKFARGQNFDVAASHGARAQALAAQRLGIPTFVTLDYEYADLRAFRHARCFMIPDVVPAAPFEKFGIPSESLRRYRGSKEHVYLAGFKPTIDVRAELGIPNDEILVTFRPASDTAHYLPNSGSGLQGRLLERLLSQNGVRVLVVPRTERQRRVFEARATERRALRVCRNVVDGPSLIFASDMVVSGGGTMIREAAVLDVPAVSCFEGRLGAVDRTLAREGKLVIVRDLEDVQKVTPVKRAQQPAQVPRDGPLNSIVQGICDTAEMG